MILNAAVPGVAVRVAAPVEAQILSCGVATGIVIIADAWLMLVIIVLTIPVIMHVCLLAEHLSFCIVLVRVLVVMDLVIMAHYMIAVTDKKPRHLQ